MNPRAAGPLDPATQTIQARSAPPCQASAEGRDEATVTVNAHQLAPLGWLLTDIDEFLRHGEALAELLADFYAIHRADPHPRFAAATLIDAVGFTVLGHHRRTDTAEGQGEHR